MNGRSRTRNHSLARRVVVRDREREFHLLDELQNLVRIGCNREHASRRWLEKGTHRLASERCDLHGRLCIERTAGGQRAYLAEAVPDGHRRSESEEIENSQ